MVNRPNLFRDYLANLVATSATWTSSGNSINSFYYGLSKEIIGAQRSEISYPAMWASFPTYQIFDNGAQNFTKKLTAKIWIITNRERDDYQGYKDAMDAMCVFVDDLLRKMKHDAMNSNGTWHFSINEQVERPLTEVFTDYDFGYELDLKVMNAGWTNFCPL